MTLTAIILVLISAVAHAGWNYTGKKANPTLAFFFLVTIAGSLLFTPVLFFQVELIKAFDSRIWGLLLLTGLFQAIYLWALASAYRSGEMSIAYPIARSSPLIIVCVSAFILGERESISGQAIAGIILIVAGCLLIPMRSFSDLRLSNYLNVTTAFALAAACATSGYSLVDDSATAQMRALNHPETGAPLATPAEIAMSYVVLQGYTSTLWMALMTFVNPSTRANVKPLLRSAFSSYMTTAVLMFGTYALVVMSMAFVSNVSYVVAFRQVSIPLGVMLGIVGLGERLYIPKITGVFITFCGLIAVALG
ncbi:multidrug DMT transporter permease [Hahella sp. CCB-MM4]|uniref:DMT family transporter n=1 Tax=Hahella sp. (strain CCB-MM4) TaxID=1926491 RepID=UPI000B9BFE5C|nr:DMT family transporter [Hahella sp. CCB-MM4]OZG70956.1 multidrug DMT transporter permease [Hahella sp. CCB-MM4]